MMDDALEHWQALKRKLTREQFVAKFAHPFLLRRSRLTAPPGEDGGFGDEERVGFSTAVVDAEALTSARPGPLRGARVMPVTKAPGNPFPDRISVGRATNCDIVIRGSTVSKLHAHFKVIGPGDVVLTDAKSANGTRVNGTRLAPGDPVRVTAGDSILFGGVSVQLLDPKRIYELL